MKKTIAMILACMMLVTVFAGCNKDESATKDLTGKAQKTALKDITDELNYLRSSSVYLKVNDSKSSYQTYIYNSHGEAIAQGSSTGNISVFKNDGTDVQFNSSITAGKDLDMITLMEDSAKLVQDGKATIKKTKTPITDAKESASAKSSASPSTSAITSPSTSTDTTASAKPSESPNSNFKYYYITVNGWDNIKALYQYAGDDYAADMVKGMQSAVGTNVETASLTFLYILGDKREFSADCEITYSGNTYTLWYIDGYLSLYDWQLANDWYTNDFSNTDTTQSESLLKSLLSDLGQMFTQYSNDNKLTESSDNNNTDAATNSSEPSVSTNP